MTNRKRRILPAVVASALGMGAAAAFAADPNQQDLQNQVKALEAKVATLEGKQAVQQADVTATIDSVLNDANKHSKMLNQMAAGQAGHNDEDGGFRISSGNDFSLNLRLGFQFRSVVNYAKDSKHNGNDDSITSGYEITRARFMVDGNAWGPNLQYFVQWDAGDLDGGFTLLDAYVINRLSDQWAIKSGQFKDPVHHEALVSPFQQLAVERSMTNELLGTGAGTAGRVQGVSLMFGNPNDALHGEVALHDGLGSANTNFQDVNAYWGASGRIEYKMMGDWKDYKDFSARDTNKDLMVLGGGFDVTQGPNFTFYRFTGDFQWEMANHLSVYGAALGQYFDPRNTGQDSSTDFGFIAQVGYAIDRQWEVFGRVDWTHFDNEQVNGENNFYEITGGVNYFLGRNGAAFHRAQISVDLTYLPNGCPANSNGIPTPGLSYLDITPGSDSGQFILRCQVQFVP